MVSSGTGGRLSLDPALPWLRRRPAAAAPIHPLAWELPYATGVAIIRKKRRRMKEINNRYKKKYLYNHRVTTNLGIAKYWPDRVSGPSGFYQMNVNE